MKETSLVNLFRGLDCENLTKLVYEDDIDKSVTGLLDHGQFAHGEFAHGLKVRLGFFLKKIFVGELSVGE